MREFCTKTLPTVSLIEQLRRQPLSQAEALYLILWCLERNVLSTAD
jgi:hypothetical protein